MLAFDIAFHERVLELQRRDPFAALLFRQGLGARHVPGGNIGEADVANLPCLYERVERRENLLDRRNHIPREHQVEINVIRLEAAQRAFHGAVDIFPAVPACVGVPRLGIERELRGEDNLVPNLCILDEFPDQLLAPSIRIHIRGVNKVAAFFKIAAKNRLRDAFVGTPAPIGSESHRSEAKWAHAQSGASQRHIFIEFHRCRSCVWNELPKPVHLLGFAATRKGYTARWSRHQKYVCPANIAMASSKGNPALSASFHDIVCVKSRKAQHRGHEESQRTTVKSAFLFPSCTHLLLRGPSVLSVAFLRVLCVQYRKARRKCARPATTSTANCTGGFCQESDKSLLPQKFQAELHLS